MRKEVDLSLFPQEAVSESNYKDIIAKKIEIDVNEISFTRIIKKSIDARRKPVKINLRVEVFVNEEPEVTESVFKGQNVQDKPSVIVVGSGPAGLFAALRLIEHGIKPIVLERGKEVGERKKDIALINRESIVNPDSNYCFGEGGAGTFSDGKLYTRSKKRGNITRALKLFHEHGAADDILFDSHPHIGSDKLPRIIKAFRKTIIDAGGKIRFDTKVVDLLINSDDIEGVITQEGETIKAEAVILATGHSAKDIYQLLGKKKIALEFKDFAVGVRVEHPQFFIDRIQYHDSRGRGKHLPPARYSLAAQVEDRGVFSFCMCPGGQIVPSATADNELVVNGMSNAQRNTPYANSGIVVQVKQADLAEYANHGIFAGLEFQNTLEKLAFQNGGNGQTAPAQALEDFVKGRISTYIPDTSYIPDVISSPVHFWLPEFISKRLQLGFKQFGKRMKGFVTNEALVVGVESRTSSPIRIPRNNDTFEHIQIKNFYPCGEGAGYSGGILSSAIDGELCADMVAKKIQDL